MEQMLKQALAQRSKQRINDAGLVSAAVLIPIYYKDGEYHILFTKRTETVKDHKGQISFPGGAYEEQDETLVNTALRECAEEIGLEAEGIELLGELDDMATRSTDYIISPFVATIPWPCSFKVDPIEVDEIIEVPLSALLDKDCVRHETEVVDGEVVDKYEYHYGGKIIWGATARILNQFLGIVSQVMDSNRE